MSAKRPQPTTITLRLTGRIARADGKAISLCNELPVGGQGNTPEEAMKSFFECLRVYLQAYEREGQLAEVLTKHGAVASRPTKEPAFRFDMPYIVSPEEHHGELVPA